MQTTNHLVLMRPANFGRASETVADNSFQEAVSTESFRDIGLRAVAEFDHFADLLRSVGVTVHTFDDTPAPVRPDAVFVNNWFSTHADGTVVTYPLFWPQRRLERRPDLIDYLEREFHVSRRLDLTEWEREGQYLESTGCLLLDRVNRIAYACLSQRCTEVALHRWCAMMDYRPVTFHAHDRRGEVIYHTNVMMAIGSQHAMVCLDAIRDPVQRRGVHDSLAAAGKRIVGLSLQQIDRFAGNALEAVSPEGPVWIMSSAAFGSLAESQRLMLVQPPGARIVHADLSTLERYGGGSARCMLGEVFLNKL